MTTATPGLAADQNDAAAAKNPPAIAWDEKKLERLDRNLRRLEQRLFQNSAAGAPPVLIEPDPEVVALQSTIELLSHRIDDLEAALKRVTNDTETSNFELRQMKTAAGSEAETQAKSLADLKQQVLALTARLDAADKAAKAAQLAADGVPDAPPPAATDTAQGAAAATPAAASSYDAFHAAMEQLLSGDYDGAAKAFDAFVQAYPSAKETPEAWYRLGEMKLLHDDYTGAAEAYINSLKGWPKTKWAADALVKLASSLDHLQRGKEACSAYHDFERRYAGSAAANVKARAAALKARLQCR